MSQAEVRVLVLERDPHGRGTAKALAADKRFTTQSISSLAAVDAAVHTFHPNVVIVVATIDDRETKVSLESVIQAHHLPTVLAAASDRQLAVLRPVALAKGAVAAETLEGLLGQTSEGESNRSRLRLFARAGSVGSASSASSVGAMRSAARAASFSSPSHPDPPAPSPPERREFRVPVVGIVASTGGPDTLPAILAAIPKPFPLPITIVQHLTGGFAETFAAWLAEASRCPVKVPADGETLLAGVVYLAPDGCHLRVTAKGTARRDRTTGDVNGHMPAGNILLSSIAEAYGPRAIGVVLTGMGVDGADGLHSMFLAGALTIAQDSATSIVDGMPARARALGAAREVLPKQRIAAAIAAFAKTLTQPTKGADKP